jgi:UDP-N-acetyl-2-amino-2-deoxyglucuronate dehydrogenase
MQTPVNVGVIGCGGISAVHLNCLCRIDNVKVVAVCDIKPERALKARQYCKDTRGWEPDMYEDYRELIARDDIQSVHLCTPHYLHAPMALAALKAGKHVMTEKPMATTLEDAHAMIAASDGRLGVIFQNRYNGSVQALRRELKSGALGKLQTVRASVLWHREAPYYTESGWRGQMDTEGGGTLINQSIHTLDLMLYTVGPAKRIKGASSIDYLKGVINVEESVHAVMEYECGARGIINCTNTNCIDAPIELEYILENGTLLLRGDRLYKFVDDECQVLFTPAKLNVGGKAYWGTGHLAQLNDYYEKMMAGEKFWLDGVQAFPALNIVKAIQQSAAEDRWVDLETMPFENGIG